MKYTNDFVPILSNEDIENEAEMFLEQYCPQALYKPMEVPIHEIAELDLGLSVDYAHLSEDLSILGMMVFSGGNVEIYMKEDDEFIYQKVDKGTIIIDPDIYSNGGMKRERFTIAHEVSHWCKHNLRFAMLAYSDKNLTAACKYSSARIVKPRTPEEWLELQADKLAAAILMPREVFKKEALRLADDYIDDKDNFLVGTIFCADIIRMFVVDELSKIFNVSKQATEIRLNTLGIKF